MLPILRILPVCGVGLAIVILVLAFSPPDGSRSPLIAAIAPARGALVDRERHPETRQFLILAALKRADELSRLRELPDTPVRADDDKDAANVAAIPDDSSDSEAEEPGPTGEILPSIPVEAGEPSSAELTVTTPEESRPAVKTPEPAKARRRAVQRHRHPRIASAPQPSYGLFGIFFSGQQYQPQNQATQSYGANQAGQTFRNNQSNQLYGVSQWDDPYGTKPAKQPVFSYTNVGPQTNPN